MIVTINFSKIGIYNPFVLSNMLIRCGFLVVYGIFRIGKKTYFKYVFKLLFKMCFKHEKYI